MNLSNLEIQFNAEVIKKVKSLNFQVDQLGSILFILFSLYESRYDLLDEFDDYNKQKRAFTLYKDIEIKGLIEPIKAEKGEPLFSLTKDGIDFVEFIKSEFKTNSVELTSTDIAVSGVENLKEAVQNDDPDLVDNWIDEWIEIFPKGVKSGGRLLRGDRLSCLRKMKIFLREYNYPKDIIMQATHNYIESKRAEGFAYTRCAVYFIFRVDSTIRTDRISDLAAWCEDTISNKKDNSTNSNNLEIMV